ncbi:hypothetical protein KH389_12965 [Pseudomonas qingdaonensis]|uniref:N-acetyltransferase domain-containing protein n=1 Tax=Pseudomonas qingdaonensis TaxID=2056231 RepID=A0ABX8DYQ2_9PSED|nr:hypothetical protein [Pseudomonas qingdaonensis]QVL21431.1 hypothetical protein KH389_12965 [Pseudomonas qingdaonensis]
MAYKISREALQGLCKILNEDRRENAINRTSAIERKLAENGYISLTELADKLGMEERRGGCAIEYILQDLISALDIPTLTLCYRPEQIGDEPFPFEGFSEIGVADLLIHLEHLGLQVDPSNLVRKLVGQLSSRRILTESELAVVEYEHRRSSRRIVLQVEGHSAAVEMEATTHADSQGMHFTVISSGDGPVRLEIQGSKYEAPLETPIVECSICRLSYVQNDPADERRHSSIHQDRMSTINPQPDPRVIALMPVKDGSLLVGPDSPLWMHDEVLKRARAFRLEFGYDRVQWDGSADNPASPEWRGHLFVSDEGAIAGACGFYAEAASPRELHWIWLAPPYRRKGLLKAAWPSLTKTYGEFDLEWPIQDAMLEFIARHGTPRQIERHRAPRSS